MCQGTVWITVNTEEPKPTTFEDLGYVQVVRCKDCKYYSGQFCNHIDVYPWPKDDWFCADGKYKEV